MGYDDYIVHFFQWEAKFEHQCWLTSESILMILYPLSSQSFQQKMPTRCIYISRGIHNQPWFWWFMLYSSGEQNILGGASFSAPVNRVFILHNNAPSKHWEISTFIIYACPGIRLIYLDLYFHQGANSGTWYFSSVGWMLYFAPALCESLKVLKLKLDSPWRLLLMYASQSSRFFFFHISYS